MTKMSAKICRKSLKKEVGEDYRYFIQDKSYYYDLRLYEIQHKTSITYNNDLLLQPVLNEFNISKEQLLDIVDNCYKELIKKMNKYNVRLGLLNNPYTYLVRTNSIVHDGYINSTSELIMNLYIDGIKNYYRSFLYSLYDIKSVKFRKDVITYKEEIKYIAFRTAENYIDSVIPNIYSIIYVSYYDSLIKTLFRYNRIFYKWFCIDLDMFEEKTKDEFIKENDKRDINRILKNFYTELNDKIL